MKLMNKIVIRGTSILSRHQVNLWYIFNNFINGTFIELHLCLLIIYSLFKAAQPTCLGFYAATRQNQVNVDEVRLTQSSSSLSYLDQLPNSVSELGTTSSSDQQLYGSYLFLVIEALK